MSDNGWDDSDDDDEIAVRIEPREDVLERLGISFEAFEEALGVAIDEYHARLDALADDDEVPTVEEMTVRIGDRSFPLRDLAVVSVSDEEE